MNDTIQSILGILERGTPELQIAAAQILGELRPRDASVTKAVARRLETSQDFLARHLLTTLGAIGTKPAVQTLVDQLERTERADLAAHLLADLGEEGAAELAERFDEASPEARARIVGILAKQHGSASLQVLEKALLDPELGRRAAEGIVEHQLDRIDGRQRSTLERRLQKTLQNGELDPRSTASVLQVLARIDPMKARPTLIKHTDRSEPAAVREAALEALADVRLTPTQARGLLAVLLEEDAPHIVAPAIRALEGVEKWPDDALPELRKLASSKREELRTFAVSTMRNAPHPDFVKVLVQHLHGESRELHLAAVEALAANPHAVEVLLRSLLQEKDVERARRTARPLARLGAHLTEKHVRSLADKGCRLLFALDPLGEVLLGTLLAARPEDGAAFLVDKAIKLRKSKRLQEAMALFAFLVNADRLDGEGRYQMAVARLLLDEQNGRHDAERAGDATMGYFAVLVRQGFPVFERLKKESVVTPQALLRVGQHFSVGIASERRFAAEVLQHVAERHGRHRAGEEARLALRSGGF